MEKPESPIRRFRRDHLKISQRALAARVGESEFRVSRIETGAQEPDMAFVRKVAALSADKAAKTNLIKALLGEAAA